MYIIRKMDETAIGLTVPVKRICVSQADSDLFLWLDGDNFAVTVALGESIWDLMDAVERWHELKFPSEHADMSVEIVGGFMQVWIDGALTEFSLNCQSWKIAIGDIELWLSAGEADLLIDAVDAFLSQFERKAEDAIIEK